MDHLSDASSIVAKTVAAPLTDARTSAFVALLVLLSSSTSNAQEKAANIACPAITTAGEAIL